VTDNRATWQRWLPLAIVLLAFGLRLYRLGASSLWYDETVSVYLAEQSLPALIAHTAGDIHPPGYYILLHAWIRLAGHSDFAVAFPSLIFGVVLVALAYRLAARFFRPEAGLLAAFLVTVSPYNLWYSQEVRMYTLAAALGMLLLEAILPLLHSRPVTLPSWPRLAAYAVCAAVGLWVLYYFAFLLAAINLMVLAWWLNTARRRSRGAAGNRLRWLGRWLLAQVAVLLFYAPWLPVAWRQVTHPPVPPWRSFTALGDLLVQTWTALSLGQSVRPAALWAWPVLLLFAVLFVLGLFCRRRQTGAASCFAAPWFLSGYIFLPVLLIGLASLVTPLFHVRYAFTYSTPFYIILAAGLVAVVRKWRPALWLGLAVVVIASGMSIGAYHADPRYATDDHRAAAHLLSERWRPGDAILVNAGYAYTALLTYWHGDPIAWHGRLLGNNSSAAGSRGPVVLQTGTVDGDPGLGWGDPASDFYAMTRAETEAALATLFGQYDRVWVYRIYDTVTDPAGTIRAWLDAHGQRFEDQVFTGESQLRVQGYLTGRDPLADAGLVGQPGAALGDGSLDLAAAAVPERHVAVGQALDLALVWRVNAPLAYDSILFAGLFDAEGRRWAQTDDRPLGSLLLPSSWPAGALVRTPLRLSVPPGTPPGSYRLKIGWYDFVSGQPRWLPWTTADRLSLGEVTVVAPDDWQALPLPQVAYPAGVTIGPGLELVGLSASSFSDHPGGSLSLDLVWRALHDTPEAGTLVFQLASDAGQVLAEQPLADQAPLAAGQVLRQPCSMDLPAGLFPGVYNLLLGRRTPDGSWLPVRRGLVGLGSTYPLATVRALGRSVNLNPPAFERRVGVRFGVYIRLLGYDNAVGQAQTPIPASLRFALYWQAIASTPGRYRLFVHLTDPGNPAGIRAQADLYPAVPTNTWTPGEYLSDDVTLELPPGLKPGGYDLLVGFYDEATGVRLPLLDAGGQLRGDSLLLQQITLGQ
jgi:uncharacterized membrane protein